MTLLIRWFRLLCLVSVIAFVALLSLRVAGCDPTESVSLWTPLLIPVVAGGVICIALGLFDSANATVRWARRHDRGARSGFGPNRSQRRRRRTRR